MKRPDRVHGRGADPAHLAIWTNGISGKWNSHFRVANVTRELPIMFEPIWNSPDEHHEIELHLPPVDREDAANWYAGPIADPSHDTQDTTDGNTAAHEFGHLVGLADEYNLTAPMYEEVTGSAPTGAMPADGYDTPSVMGDHLESGRGAPLAPFVAWLNANGFPGRAAYRAVAGGRPLLGAYSVIGGSPPPTLESLQVFTDGNARAIVTGAGRAASRWTRPGCTSPRSIADRCAALIAGLSAGEHGPIRADSGRTSIKLGEDGGKNRLGRVRDARRPRRPGELRTVLDAVRRHPVAAVRLEFAEDGARGCPIPAASRSASRRPPARRRLRWRRSSHVGRLPNGHRGRARCPTARWPRANVARCR